MAYRTVSEEEGLPVALPEVLPHLSSRRVLTMTFEAGCSVTVPPSTGLELRSHAPSTPARAALDQRSIEQRSTPCAHRTAASWSARASHPQRSLAF